MVGDLRDVSFEDALEQPLHVFCLEGRLERDHLVDDAAETPDVTLDVVRLVLPNFGTRVVWRPSLRVVEACLVCDLRYVHVTQLGRHVVVQEDVCAFEVSMHDLDLVHGLQASHCLDENLPDLALLDVRLLLLVLHNFLEHITVVGQLHDNTTTIKSRDEKD